MRGQKPKRDSPPVCLCTSRFNFFRCPARISSKSPGRSQDEAKEPALARPYARPMPQHDAAILPDVDDSKCLTAGKVGAPNSAAFVARLGPHKASTPEKRSAENSDKGPDTAGNQAMLSIQRSAQHSSQPKASLSLIQGRWSFTLSSISSCISETLAIE